MDMNRQTEIKLKHKHTTHTHTHLREYYALFLWSRPSNRVKSFLINLISDWEIFASLFSSTICKLNSIIDKLNPSTEHSISFQSIQYDTHIFRIWFDETDNLSKRACFRFEIYIEHTTNNWNFQLLCTPHNFLS